MASLVLELQQDAMNPQVKVSDLLRKALVVATKLNVREFKEWSELELRGYAEKQDVPKYRCLRGEVKATHPQYGLIPFICEDSKLTEKLSVRGTYQSIGSLENLIERLGPKGVMNMPYPPAIVNQLDSGNLRLGIVPTLVIDRSTVYGILEAVRNIVLEWSLKLEADDIMGEGLTFSKQEKQKASINNYHIEHFAGIIGDVHGKNVQIGDFSSIHAELKRAGISQEDRTALETMLDRLRGEAGRETGSYAARNGLASKEWNDYYATRRNNSPTDCIVRRIRDGMKEADL